MKTLRVVLVVLVGLFALPLVRAAEPTIDEMKRRINELATQVRAEGSKLFPEPMPIAFTAEPPTAPVLRIEAGMHTNEIECISTDADGRLVLTVSPDKTARLWELPTGRLLRVLRPPVGEGLEGALGAGTLSPDGALAAVGGWTGLQWDRRRSSIYVFDAATGRLVRRLEGFQGSGVLDLAFSEKGHFLAAVKDGLRVWNTKTWQEIGRDADYDEQPSHGLSWHGEDRLVTTCFDGQLRLYELAEVAGHDSLTLLKKNAVQGGNQFPCSVRFSPDGRLIAVGFSPLFSSRPAGSSQPIFNLDGFDYSRAVTVVDGSDLTYRFTPNLAAVNGSISTITWTDDGATLAAGGSWEKERDKGETLVRCWTERGKGRPIDIVTAADAGISDLRALPGGRILFATSAPTWGTLSASGPPLLLGTPSMADYGGSPEGLRLSGDGATVAFNYRAHGKVPARFSVPNRVLDILDDVGAVSSLSAPLTEGVDVRDWKELAPKLNGRPLVLNNNEMSGCLAIARNAQFFLLGTNQSLRSYKTLAQSQKGARGSVKFWGMDLTKNLDLSKVWDEGWDVLPNAVVWAVNLADRDRLAVAALGDGTIRWYRVEDGKELLALFPHADRRRWVLWTPEGYYDASPGAEDLVGFHVNRGKDRAADFFSAGHFRNVFYRPDVVARVLQTRDVGQALAEANRALGRPKTKLEDISKVITRLSPPVVELETGGVFGKIALPANATELPIRYTVRQTGAEPPSKVTVRFNGRLLDMVAPLPKAGKSAEVNVPVPPGMAGELTVLAEHRLAVSEPAVLRIERDGPASPRQPNLYLVSVGVGELKVNHATGGDGAGKVTTRKKIAPSANLKEGDLVLDDLPHVADDARQIAAAFDAQKGRLYARVVTNLLLDKAATVPALREAFRSAAKQAGPEDVAVFFFSGHGVIDAKSGFYLATYEADPKNPAATAMTGKELSTLLEGIKARTVLALDTCHAGGAFGGTRLAKVITSPNDLTGLINEFSSAEQGTVVMSSSAATEQSLEDPKKGGLFTVALREGLEGKGAGRAKTGGTVDTTVSCVGLRDWLTQRVPELVAALVQGAPNAPPQTPVCVIPKGVPDFPLAKP